MGNTQYQDINNVAVLCGTPSLEHEISLISAAFITEALLQLNKRCEVFWISKDLQWFRILDISAWLDDPKNINHIAKAAITPIFGVKQKQWQSLDGSQSGQIDFILPIFHGHYGEDGAMQGLLKIWDVPFLGPKVNDAVITFNKVYSKILLEHAGIQTSPWQMFSNKKEAQQFTKPDDWSFPLFIKAACSGSSIGIFKADNDAQLVQALDDVFNYDEVCLVEQGIVGQELEVAVLIEDEIKAVGPGELIIDADFYDYKAKYIDDSSKVLSQANLTDSLKLKLQQIAIDVCKVLQCKSLARVDFLLDKDNNIFVNEVNAIPGFTPISLFPKLWQEAGVAADQLLKRMIEMALQDDHHQQAFMHNARHYIQAVINDD